jgi:hypothetical protein
MLDNHLYNLYKQIVVENKSLWRIKGSYKDDSKECKDCQKLWEELAKEKEEWVDKLEKHLKSHIK